MELMIAKDPDELSRELAGWMTGYIRKVLEKKNFFSLVLSGGDTPKKLYQVLGTDPFKKNIEWDRIHFFWGDERLVPFSDERNNAKMVFDHLLSHVPAAREQVHVINTDREPLIAAAEYEKLLKDYFKESKHSFDLVLLGLGDNAHTLSLFPGYDVILEKKHWVRAFYLGEQKMYRITLTAPVINAASEIAFVVSGEGKAVAMRHVLEESHDPGIYPAQAIKPVNGGLFWWVDEAAAKNLTIKGRGLSTN